MRNTAAGGAPGEQPPCQSRLGDGSERYGHTLHKMLAFTGLDIAAGFIALYAVLVKMLLNASFNCWTRGNYRNFEGGHIGP